MHNARVANRTIALAFVEYDFPFDHRENNKIILSIPILKKLSGSKTVIVLDFLYAGLSLHPLYLHTTGA